MDMGKPNKCDSKTWYFEVETYKEVMSQLGRYLKQDELIKNKYGLRSANWYRFNAPEETKIKTYFDFLEWCGYIKQQPKTKEDATKRILKMQENLERPIIGTDFKNAKSGDVNYRTVMKFWSGINDMQRELDLVITNSFDGFVYTKDSIIEKIHEYYIEYGEVPTPAKLEIPNKKYPSRKTVEKYFGSIRNAVEDAGYEYSNNTIKGTFVDKKYQDKDYLSNIVIDYVDKHGESPTLNDITKQEGRELKRHYKKYFGSWNKCLNELGVPLNAVSKYTDDELKASFMDFINKYGRVPSIRDFNASGRPSFWVYQQRFGSWAEACIYYGFKPNCRETKYYMDNGEVCDSSYEYDISKWLQGNNIHYERNIPYMDFINNYKGKMNCDYKFELDNGQIWYVEMAGFIHTHDITKLKQRPEQLYYFKLKYKQKLLKREDCNYLIISVDDIKNKSLSEIFEFLK